MEFNLQYPSQAYMVPGLKAKRDIPLVYITDTVCRHFKTNMEEIIKPSRMRDVVMVRQIIMYFCDMMTGLSSAKIASFFNKDRCTAIQAAKVVKRQAEVDIEFRKMLVEIKRKIDEGQS